MAFSNTKSPKRLVPWFSIHEWESTSKMIYSGDNNERIIGYNTLLAWKSRCPTELPTGVECTLYLVQATLQEQQIWQNEEICNMISVDQECRMIYSTAIIRFLNHATNPSQNRAHPISTFAAASTIGIPDWLVNMRHEATHRIMPSLEVLRAGTQAALQWLKTNYWDDKRTNSSPSETKPSDDPFRGKLFHRMKNILENYLKLSLYVQASYEYISEVDDYEMKFVLNSLHVFKKHDDMKLTECLKSMCKKVYIFMNRCKLLNRTEEWCRCIVKSNSLIPMESVYDVLQSLQGCGISDSLPSDLVSIWSDLLVMIHKAKLLPVFITSLIHVFDNKTESLYRKKVALQWIEKLITLKLGYDSPTKSIPQHSVVSPSVNKNKRKKKKKKLAEIGVNTSIEVSDLVWTVENSGVVWETEESIVDLIQMFLKKPNEWKLQFLPKILSLAESTIGKEKCNMILELTNIYLNTNSPCDNESIEDDMDDDVYCVDDLINGRIKKCNILHDDLQEEGWAICNDPIDWSSCPVGVLPWQRNNHELNLTLPSTEWVIRNQQNYLKRSKGDEMFDDTSSTADHLQKKMKFIL